MKNAIAKKLFIVVAIVLGAAVFSGCVPTAEPRVCLREVLGMCVDYSN